MELQDLAIACRRDNRTRTMPMQYAKIDGKIIYAPCDGCEHCDGGSICKSCIEYVNSVCLHALTEPVLSLIHFRVENT